LLGQVVDGLDHGVRLGFAARQGGARPVDANDAALPGTRIDHVVGNVALVS